MFVSQNKFYFNIKGVMASCLQANKSDKNDNNRK